MISYAKALVFAAIKLWRARPMQGALSALGIVVGVSGLVIVIAIGSGAEAELRKALGSLGTGSVIVRDNNNSLENRDSALSLRQRKRVERLLEPAVTMASAVSHRSVTATAGSQRLENVQLVGTDAAYFHIYRLRTRLGRGLSEHDFVMRRAVCVLGSHAARTLYPRGQVLGQSLQLDGMWCEVVGVLQEQSYGAGSALTSTIEQEDNVVLTPLTVIGGSSPDQPIDELIVKFKDESMLKAALASLKRAVTGANRDESIEFIIPIEVLRQKQRVQMLFQYVLLSVAGLMLTVGGTGIMNVMLLNVISRRSEIGLRRAIGASKKDIAAQFLVESLVVSVLGGLIGVSLGYGIAELVNTFSAWSMHFTFTAAAIGFATSIVIGAVFGSYPALQAATVSPVHSLRQP